jgi:chemotaxis protein CheC
MISPDSLDILKELLNIAVGKGAQVLNTMLRHHVSLSVPEILQTSHDQLDHALGLEATQVVSCVQMAYRGSLQGEVQLLFPAEEAAQMVNLITDEVFPPEELDFIRQATLTEVGNVVINAVMGTLSNLFKFHLQYGLPTYLGGTVRSVSQQGELKTLEKILLARTTFRIESINLNGSLVLFFSLPTFQSLESALDTYVRS